MGTVIVTGATKGIGLAIAEKFAANGHDLAICSRNNQELKQLANRLEKAHGIAVYYEQCDVSDKDDIALFAQHLQDQVSNPEVLINNAGVFIPGKVSEEQEGTLEQMLNTNLLSAYWLTRALMPALQKQPKAYIFNMCSTASRMAYANGGSYAISKFALLGFTKALRAELVESAIKVSAVMPGPTYSASWEGADIPKERFMQPEEVAACVYTAYTLPGNAVMEELVMRPQLGDL